MATIILFDFWTWAILVIAVMVPYGIGYCIGYHLGITDEKSYNEYDSLYGKIHSYIHSLPVESYNYDWILEEFKQFDNIRYKDKERTSILMCAFLRKFEVEHLKRVA